MMVGLRVLGRRERRGALAMLSLLLVMSIVQAEPLVNSQSGPTEASGFNVLTTTWGTASAPISAGPGSQYVPLTVSLQYFFTNTATSVQMQLSMPLGFSDANGGPVSVAFVTSSVNTGATVTVTFYVNISPSVAVGIYYFPLQINWGAQISSQVSVALVQHTYATAFLKGKALLSFQSFQTSLIPGQVNSIRVALVNTGSGPATGITTTVTASAASLSILSPFPTLASLPPNTNSSTILRVFVPSSLASSALGLTFAASYLDSNGNAATLSQTLGFYTVSTASVTAATSLSVTPTSNTLVAGSASNVAFLIKNTGQQAAYYPTISLATTTPLVVTGNSSVSYSTTVIGAGSALAYSVQVTTASGTAGGYYTGTITVTFSDQFGDGFTQSVPVPFLVTVPLIQVTASSVASQIGVGKSSQVAFMITNSGNTPIYSPTFTLTVPTSLAVTVNSTFSKNGLVINPGRAVKYVANVTTGPKSSEGAYISTLTVAYLDQFGNSHTQSFSMGLVAVAVIQMVIQSQRVAGNGSTYSLSGTLVNEGQGNAYYAEAVGTITVGTRPVATASNYLGEVDVNTPLPITLQMVVPEGVIASLNGTSSATFTLTITYQNDFGQTLQYKSTQRVNPPSGSSTGVFTSTQTNRSTSKSSTASIAGIPEGDLIRYGAIAGLVAAVLVTVAYLWRGRSRRGGRLLRKPEVY
jgi:hypothetical protein